MQTTSANTASKPLIGRERELGEIKALLNSTRLLTLTGIGGTGKTALALQTAADLRRDFAHGVYIIPLAPITDPAMMLSIIAQRLKLTETIEQSAAAMLKQALRDKHLLLVLDGLTQTVAPMVANLLTEIPGVTLILTSREPLGIEGEQAYAVPPLSHEAATALFTERAQVVRPKFQQSDENRPTMVDICTQLNCQPLLIELAAGYIELFSAQQIARRLENSLNGITEPQQLLKGVIAWSYSLLDDPEKWLLATLSVFTGGFTIEAAKMVTRIALIDGLESLTHKHLICRCETRCPDLRYAMPDPVRAYALERLADSGQGDRLHQQHTQYFLQMVENCTQSAEQLDQLDENHDNIRAAIAWSLHQNETDITLRMLGALRSLGRNVG